MKYVAKTKTVMHSTVKKMFIEWPVPHLKLFFVQ